MRPRRNCTVWVVTNDDSSDEEDAAEYVDVEGIRVNGSTGVPVPPRWMLRRGKLDGVDLHTPDDAEKLHAMRRQEEAERHALAEAMAQNDPDDPDAPPQPPRWMTIK